MKKIFFFLLFATFAVNAQQPKFDFPLNENGQIIFTEVVPAEGKTKQDLFTNSKMFFVNTYKVTQDKLKQNAEASSVSDTQYSIMTVKINGADVKVKLYYTVAILSKDNKYKYEIKNIITKTEVTETPLEKLFDKTAAEKAAQKPKTMEILNAYYGAINAEIETIKSNIKKEMSKASANKNDW
ncbi:DUF4468 domain-containing protein [Flavobacterium sp. SM15]|uniref:DUF4468 domain-containing protein n=1 Tax=Flavobacterium sp. SM15 TaxID=2908005 RepID=UPI001EDB638D|nr:DUF4468 domain-containing protein [Flavobacterium sp. SM15]MCG2612463.1 DUF4468 domain-containing protein [Flavobacterium sp. SM15]